MLNLVVLLLVIYSCLALLPGNRLWVLRGIFAFLAFIPVALFFSLVLVAMDGSAGARDVAQQAWRIVTDLPNTVRDFFRNIAH